MSSDSKSRSAGWWIERRAVIAAPFAAAAAVIIARSAAAQSTPAASAAAALNGRMLDFAEFVAACEALAADLLRDEKRNHDLYLHRIAALCSRVALSQVPRGKLFAAAGLDRISSRRFVEAVEEEEGFVSEEDVCRETSSSMVGSAPARPMCRA